MMQIFLIDDDAAVRSNLRLLIEEDEHGCILGEAASGAEALEMLCDLRPDIVLVDLLMPEMDGIEFIRQAKARWPSLRFIMLSQVSAKPMIAEAYEAGADFFISKPINSVEVTSVLSRVAQLQSMNRTMQQLQAVLQGSAAPAPAPRPAAPAQSAAAQILHRIGLGGDPAYGELLQVVDYISASNDHEKTVSQLCARFSASPKAMEQRLRRAVMAGLVNLANLGLEDYANDTFTEYAGTLYHFEQVRREMDYIRGKSPSHGKISLKRFLYALAAKNETT